jgi:hypothetical protein
VSRVEEGRRRQEVDQEFMMEVREEGKSEPRSTIQDMVREMGGGEKRRAPSAE